MNFGQIHDPKMTSLINLGQKYEIFYFIYKSNIIIWWFQTSHFSFHKAHFYTKLLFDHFDLYATAVRFYLITRYKCLKRFDNGGSPNRKLTLSHNLSLQNYFCILFFCGSNWWFRARWKWWWTKDEKVGLVSFMRRKQRQSTV